MRQMEARARAADAADQKVLTRVMAANGNPDGPLSGFDRWSAEHHARLAGIPNISDYLEG